MKWLFWLLLAVNAGLFAYMQWGKGLAAETAATVNQPPLNADKIKLLPDPSDIQSTTALAATAVAASAPASAVPLALANPSDTACLEWGEFSGGDLKRANAALDKLNLGDQLTKQQVEYASGYWAYLPPSKTRAEIDRKIAQLKARGVADYFIVQQPGKWRNAISLGVFKTREAANKFVGKLSAKGIKTAAVGERASKLKFTVFVLKNPDAATMEKMAQLHDEFDGGELRSVACKQP